MFLLAKSNPAKFGMTSKKVNKIKKFCDKCYSNFLCGNLFTNYLTGLIGSIEEDSKNSQQKVDPINKNKEFMENFHEYLTKKIGKIQMLLSNPNDMTSHSEYLNLLMMYALNRRLFETKDQEREIYKKIWALQKDCPLIIIYNNLKCSPGKFLLEVCALKKKSKSLDPKGVGPFLQNETKNRNA